MKLPIKNTNSMQYILPFRPILSISFIIAMCIMAAGSFDAGDARIDASSADSITESTNLILESVKEDPDLGMQDKGAIAMAISASLLGAVQYTLEKGGPNASERQQEALMVEYFKKYDGMNPTEFLQAFVKENKK